MKSKIVFIIIALVALGSCTSDNSIEENLVNSELRLFFPEEEHGKEKNPIQERATLINREMLVKVTNFAGDFVRAIISINGEDYVSVYSEDRKIAYHYPTFAIIPYIDAAGTVSTTYYDKKVSWFGLKRMYEGVSDTGSAVASSTGETWTLTVIERY